MDNFYNNSDGNYNDAGVVDHVGSIDEEQEIQILMNRGMTRNEAHGVFCDVIFE
jgi:hypothetical protein